MGDLANINSCLLNSFSPSFLLKENCNFVQSHPTLLTIKCYGEGWVPGSGKGGGANLNRLSQAQQPISLAKR